MFSRCALNVLVEILRLCRLGKDNTTSTWNRVEAKFTLTSSYSECKTHDVWTWLLFGVVFSHGRDWSLLWVYFEWSMKFVWTCCDMLFCLTQDDDCLATRHSQGAIEGTPKVFAPESLGIIRLFRCTVIFSVRPGGHRQVFVRKPYAQSTFGAPHRLAF